MKGESRTVNITQNCKYTREKFKLEIWKMPVFSSGSWGNQINSINNFQSKEVWFILSGKEYFEIILMKKTYFHIGLPLIIAFTDVTYIWIKITKLLNLKGYKISFLISVHVNGMIQSLLSI